MVEPRQRSKRNAPPDQTVRSRATTKEPEMETQSLHRGRLIDHIQLVVRDLDATRRFYDAVFEVLGVPLGGEGDSYFWADELFVSTAGSEAAAGQLTGRC